MTDSIFAGSLSLTDEIPEDKPQESGSKLAAFAASSPPRTVLGMETYHPLPEPHLSTAAERVREEARRLGIDYDAEVAKVLHRVKATGLQYAPGPYNKTAGPDPLADVSAEDRRMAEYAATEILKRKHNL